MFPLLLAVLAITATPGRPLDWDGAAEHLSTTVRHVRELVYRREIPFTRVGRLIRFLPEDLNQYLAERRVSERAS